jgi:hypothetical protein
MFAALFLASTLVAPAADSREAARERAAELVQRLADPAFKVREHASDELVKLGSSAVDALRKGLTHPDPEVGERCRKLLPQALDIHFQEQIDKFLAKPDGPITDDLPGLKRWLKVTGSSKESREAYAGMVKEHRRVLIEIEANPDQATQKYQAFFAGVYARARVSAINARPEWFTRSEMVLFFFLGSDPNCRKGTAATGTVPYAQALQFLNGTQVQDMLAGSGASPSFQKLFLAWLEQERYLTLIRKGFQLATIADLKEAGPIAIKIALDKSTAATSRSYALLGAGKLIGAADLKKLELLMEEKTVIGRVAVADSEPVTTELRDIALGIAVQASGQKLADYGFDRFRETTPPTASVSYTIYGLTEKKREEAFAKWKEWSAKNKK